MNKKTENLIVRTITGAIYATIMVVCFLRPEGMVFVFALITAMTIWEFCSLMNDHAMEEEKEYTSTTPEQQRAACATGGSIVVNRFICAAAGIFLTLAMFGYASGLTPALIFIPYLLTILYLFIAELYLRQPNPINNWAYAMFSQLYIALPLSTISILAYYNGAFYFLLPLCVFVFLWCNDTGAYLVGSLCGRHKLFPRVSPNKSWEGSIGGALLVAVAAALVWHVEAPHHLSGLSLPQWLGLGLVVVVFGTWGDLVESLLKRTLGIKDSGNILPGHGGMLDRFDSALLAIPAVVVYLYTISLW